MAAIQKLLFPDPRPLVERFGHEFFRKLPESSGVYLMRDSDGVILYIGKAKNLRKRLASYRVANPERLRRSHLRLLRAVDHIEIQETADEAAALAREAELLRSIRPRFNRAGTWPAPRRFITFLLTEDALELRVATDPPADVLCHGPHEAGAYHLRNSLARLVWLAFHPGRGVSQLPVGWFHGGSDEVLTWQSSSTPPEFASKLESLFQGEADSFAEWVRAQIPPSFSAFEKTVIEADLEFVLERFQISH